MNQGRRGWRPVCQECKNDRKPREVTELAGLQFCEVCLKAALVRIEEQRQAKEADG